MPLFDDLGDSCRNADQGCGAPRRPIAFLAAGVYGLLVRVAEPSLGGGASKRLGRSDLKADRIAVWKCQPRAVWRGSYARHCPFQVARLARQRDARPQSGWGLTDGARPPAQVSPPGSAQPTHAGIKRKEPVVFVLHCTPSDLIKVRRRADIGDSPRWLARAGGAGLAALSALLLSLGSAPAYAHPTPRHAYTLIDLGTFGGPQADVGNAPSLNESGTVVGTADTTVLDPFGANQSPAFNGDPFVQHAYEWQRRVMTDLGALGSHPAGNSS